MAIGLITGVNIKEEAFEIKLSKNTVLLDKAESTTVTINTPSDGKIFANVSDANVANVTINDNILTVTALNYGSTMIYIGQDNGTGDYANTTPVSGILFCIVTIAGATATLNDNSWSIISKVSKAGIGSSVWSIGDLKELTLTGKVGTHLTLSYKPLCVYILHFNYPLNGVADNNIIWGGFSSGLSINRQVALVDSYYYSDQYNYSYHCFNINHSRSQETGNLYAHNYGGWKGCDLRYDVIGATDTPPNEYSVTYSTTARVGYNASTNIFTNPPADTLLNVLLKADSNLKNCLRLWPRWIDARGNSSTAQENIEETIDAITLLAEFEVFGTCTYANPFEADSQTQMDYYASGNSKIKNKHTDTTSTVYWWLASPNSKNFNGYCLVTKTGACGSNPSITVWGVAPAFMT